MTTDRSPYDRVAGWLRRLAGLAAVLCAFSVYAGPAPPSLQLSMSSSPIAPGCAYEPVDLEKYGGQPFRDAPSVSSKNGVLDVALDVHYAIHMIAGCEVRHRSYNGALVGPTLRVRPGDTIRLRLRNLLPPNPKKNPDASPHAPAEDHNTPHDFNTTNLHTHGLHVSPSGKSDNVLLKIRPGDSFDYEIVVPADHPPGTFWYHAHVHGSTAIQLSSGMAGALIVEGGLDAVPEIARSREKTFLFQHIAYDDQGQIEDFDELLGPGSWERLKRHTTVNGQIVPVIRMRPGEVQRWRLIHGGIRESILLKLEGHILHEIAVDGLALGRLTGWRDGIELQPGYRSDVLIKAKALPEGQTRQEFLLVDAESQPVLSLLGILEKQTVLAKLVVEGPAVDMALPVARDLVGLVPHKPVADDELSGRQQVVFSISLKEDGGFAFTVNGRPFSNDHVRRLKLGRAEEWTLRTALTSLTPNHPFHIHVNPFQSIRAGPDGQPEIVWRDTLLVRKGKPQKIRTRYTRYTGLFVLHCHMLDHEDQGMMELVEIVE